MRTVLAAAAAVLVIGLAWHGPGRAALDKVRHAQPTMELLVFEHPDCSYCQAFRARIAPSYRQSEHEAQAPLRFVDVSNSGTELESLKAPINMVPTAVVLKNGREVDRIAGYWAPGNFFKMVAFIISRAE
jgi:thioredoxin-related protein